MSRLVARILLAILMFPAGTVLYLTTFVYCERRRTYYDTLRSLTFAGAVTWAFVAVYWICLWRGSVRWTVLRRVLTLVAAAACAVGGLVVYGALIGMGLYRDFAGLVATITAPVVWLIATVLLWRERADER